MTFYLSDDMTEQELTDAAREQRILADAERVAWRDAYYIAWVGASNPKGVARSLSQWLPILGSNHPAVEAITGHLAFLNGESMGPSSEVLDKVLACAVKLGIHE